MTHYICTGGCGAVKDAPGVCGAETCAKHGQSFGECDCIDNQHHGSVDFKHDHAHELPAVEEKPNLPMETK